MWGLLTKPRVRQLCNESGAPALGDSGGAPHTGILATACPSPVSLCPGKQAPALCPPPLSRDGASGPALCPSGGGLTPLAALLYFGATFAMD